MGVRAVAWFKGYAAGLYLRREAARRRRVAPIGPEAHPDAHADRDRSEDFKKALVDGMQRNVSEAEWRRAGPAWRSSHAIGRSAWPSCQGDVINLDYVPEQRLALAVNGVAKGERHRPATISTPAC